ncbi:hypothetical protein KRMM14A1004_26960 [Krasilnikovia sp. MM14-A1004]
MTELAMAAAITVGVGGASYAAMDVQGLTRSAEAVAERATCRAVDEAIVAYYAQEGKVAQRLAELQPFVQGDISAYRIRDGRAAGPGCPPRTPR